MVAKPEYVFTNNYRSEVCIQHHVDYTNCSYREDAGKLNYSQLTFRYSGDARLAIGSKN